jgi:hypothetical protein
MLGAVARRADVMMARSRAEEARVTVQRRSGANDGGRGRYLHPA